MLVRGQEHLQRELLMAPVLTQPALPFPPRPAALSTSMDTDSLKLFPKKPLRKGSTVRETAWVVAVVVVVVVLDTGQRDESCDMSTEPYEVVLAIEGSQQVPPRWGTRRPTGRSAKNGVNSAKTHPPPPLEHLVASAIGLDLRMGVHLHGEIE